MTVRAFGRVGFLLAIGLVLAAPARAEETPAGEGSLHELVRALNEQQNGLAYGQTEGDSTRHETESKIRNWLKVATAERWGDRRERNALVVYLLSGGSGSGARASLETAKLEDSEKDLIMAAVAYSQGRFDSAESLLKVDPLNVEPIVGAHIALAQVTMLIERDSKKAFDLLGVPALLAPGTLIEEASARRRILLAAAHPEVGSLPQAVRSYMRRFGRSVYFDALATALSNALVTREIEAQEEVGSIVSALGQLPSETGASILLRLAELQAAQGRLRVVQSLAEPAFSASAEGSRNRARARVYKIVAELLADPPKVSFADLNRVEGHLLSPSDEALLGAAREVLRNLDISLVETAELGEGPPGDEHPLVKKAQVLVSEADQLLENR
jgi:chemotaxis protein MotC